MRSRLPRAGLGLESLEQENTMLHIEKADDRYATEGRVTCQRLAKEYISGHEGGAPQGWG